MNCELIKRKLPPRWCNPRVCRWLRGCPHSHAQVVDDDVEGEEPHRLHPLVSARQEQAQELPHVLGAEVLPPEQQKQQLLGHLHLCIPGICIPDSAQVPGCFPGAQDYPSAGFPWPHGLWEQGLTHTLSIMAFSRLKSLKSRLAVPQRMCSSQESWSSNSLRAQKFF